MVKRLSLKSNGPTQLIKRRPILKKPNSRGEKDIFPLLLFKRPDEKISRVDRYSIVMYWSGMDDEGNPVMNSEMFFYPSDFGMKEIDDYTFNKEAMILDSNWSSRLIYRLDQLRRYGNLWWRNDTNVILTPDNWILDKKKSFIDSCATYHDFGYSISNPSHSKNPIPVKKPVIKKRILKPKEETPLQKHSLKSKGRLQLRSK